MKTSWDLSKLLQSEDPAQINLELQNTINRCNAFVDKWSNNTAYLNDANILFEALTDYEALIATCGVGGNSAYYFGLKGALDQSNTQIKAWENKISDVSVKLHNSLEFFLHKLSKVPPVVQENFLATPKLNEYTHLLKRLFEESKYLLSEPEEKILTLKSGVSYGNWVSMTSDFLSRESLKVRPSKGTSNVKNFSELLDLVDDKDKVLRVSAAKAVNKILEKHVNTAEVELNSVLEDKKIEDQLRKFPRPDASVHLEDDITSDVVDSLRQAVSSRYDIPHAFYKQKAKMLEQNTLTYFEKNISIGEVEKTYSLSEAVDIVSQVFTKLDPLFGEILNTFIENGQIDFYPKTGKTSGAFCSQGLKSQQGFILLNFTGKLNDVMALAHEAGHAINHELMRCNNALNYGVSTLLAEVASTFFEDMVLAELSTQVSPHEQEILQMSHQNDAMATIFRQIACYDFEWDLHTKFREIGYLSKDYIGELFKSHMSRYLGPAVKMPKGSENWWVYWSHIRRYFYVYSYAGGLLIAKALQRDLKSGDITIGDVKELFSVGTSLSPTKALSQIGLDITKKDFWLLGLDQLGKNVLKKQL